MNSSILVTNNLSIGYGKKIITENINIQIERGKITSCIGPNGSGKSTLLKVLSGIMPAIRGEVLINDKKMMDYSEKEKARTIAVMMTGYNSTEFMNCEEVVALGRFPYTGRFGMLTSDDIKLVEEAMVLTGVEELRNRDFMKLSDGQRQRVLLARAICQQPEILIMDEPTTYLDISYKLELLSILRKLVDDTGLTVLMSVHDIELAGRISDNVICVSGGKCIMERSEIVFTDEYIMKLYNVNKEHFDKIYKGEKLI